MEDFFLVHTEEIKELKFFGNYIKEDCNTIMWKEPQCVCNYFCTILHKNGRCKKQQKPQYQF